MTFNEQYQNYKNLIDDYLKLPELKGKALCEPVQYCLNAGGKRLRPVLFLAFYEAYGGDLSHNAAAALSCALEMLHTSTLIQDDLPCMDDDDLRRGKPACHKAFSEADAVLSASALQFYALQKITEASPPNVTEIIKTICAYMGIDGVYGGQRLDLLYEKTTPTTEEILTMYSMKTCALLQACCICGCLAAGLNIIDKAVETAGKYAYYLGLAFQITDDILELTGNEETLGKPAGSDLKNNKKTYAAVTGLEKAREDAEKFTEEALGLLKNVPNPEFITKLTKNLLNREN
ncbi:MAG: polyprenyl synthetase family protein [Oscillospiraceae bacterium]|nr:polyprenyl synthetase family protein [Oscillospiraceae bacterium]